jgi:predicted nucleic acid-binding protein
MTLVFADTFYFLAIMNAKDIAHRKAIEFSTSHDVALLTTAWVLTELADGLADSLHRSAFRRIVNDLQNDSEAIVIPPSQRLFEQGADLYNARKDKEWSLTDCISFIAMEQYSVREALTGDRHFEQAGFKALLG